MGFTFAMLLVLIAISFTGIAVLGHFYGLVLAMIAAGTFVALEIGGYLLGIIVPLWGAKRAGRVLIKEGSVYYWALDTWFRRNGVDDWWDTNITTATSWRGARKYKNLCYLGTTIWVTFHVALVEWAIVGTLYLIFVVFIYRLLLKSWLHWLFTKTPLRWLLVSYPRCPTPPWIWLLTIGLAAVYVLWPYWRWFMSEVAVWTTCYVVLMLVICGLVLLSVNPRFQSNWRIWWEDWLPELFDPAARERSKWSIDFLAVQAIRVAALVLLIALIGTPFVWWPVASLKVLFFVITWAALFGGAILFLCMAAEGESGVWEQRTLAFACWFLLCWFIASLGTIGWLGLRGAPLGFWDINQMDPAEWVFLLGCIVFAVYWGVCLFVLAVTSACRAVDYIAQLVFVPWYRECVPLPVERVGESLPTTTAAADRSLRPRKAGQPRQTEMLVLRGIAEWLLVIVLLVLVKLLLVPSVRQMAGAIVLVGCMLTLPRFRYTIGWILFVVVPKVWWLVATIFKLVLSPFRLLSYLGRPLTWTGHRFAYAWGTLAEHASDLKEGLCPLVEVKIEQRPEPEEPEVACPGGHKLIPMSEVSEEEPELTPAETALKESVEAVEAALASAESEPSVPEPLMEILEPFDGEAIPHYRERLCNELYARAVEMISQQYFGPETLTPEQLEAALDWDPRFLSNVMSALGVLWGMPSAVTADRQLVTGILGAFRNFRPDPDAPKMDRQKRFLEQLSAVVVRVERKQGRLPKLPDDDDPRRHSGIDEFLGPPPVR